MFGHGFDGMILEGMTMGHIVPKRGEAPIWGDGKQKAETTYLHRGLTGDSTYLSVLFPPFDYNYLNICSYSTPENFYVHTIRT